MGPAGGGVTRAHLILTLALVAACSQDSGTVIGVVTAVDGDLTEVRTFTMLVEGDEMTFVPAPDGEFAFPLTHLREHMRDGTLVRVGWERDGDAIRALVIADG